MFKVLSRLFLWKLQKDEEHSFSEEIWFNSNMLHFWTIFASFFLVYLWKIYKKFKSFSERNSIFIARNNVFKLFFNVCPVYFLMKNPPPQKNGVIFSRKFNFYRNNVFEWFVQGFVRIIFWWKLHLRLAGVNPPLTL